MLTQHSFTRYGTQALSHSVTQSLSHSVTHPLLDALDEVLHGVVEPLLVLGLLQPQEEGLHHIAGVSAQEEKHISRQTNIRQTADRQTAAS